MKKKIILAFKIILIGSCTTSNNEYSEKKIFRYNEHSGISSLDPAFARTQSNIWAVNQLFNGLVQLDDSLNVLPDIAKAWEIAPNKLTYNFFLRTDVKFHKHFSFQTPDSTRKVTAHDFEYSFSRLQNSEISAPGGWILQNVRNYKSLNDSVFQIELKKEFPAFLALMATQYACVVPKEVVAYYGEDFRKHPIGTGAFAFHVWDENNKLILRKNPNYHEKDAQGKSLPYLDGIAISFYREKQSEFLAFIQGNLDFLNSIDGSYKDEILTSSGELNPKYDEQIRMQKSPYLNTEYLGIVISEDNILSNKMLRKAIHLGINREQLIRFLRNGVGIPAHGGFLPKGIQGFLDENKNPYAPDKAKEIVRNYIEKHGNKPFLQIATDGNYQDICEYIQRELQKVGFDCRIDLMPSSTLRQSRATAKLPVFRASWIADYPDAENYFSLFYSKNIPPKGSNYTHFSNSQFDLWYEKSFKVPEDERLQLYQKMDSLIMDELPVIPIYYDETIRFTQKNIEGLKNNPINLLQLKSVKKQ
ncbi:Dipeptide-binding protein [Capnocytophaga canimorsus Cc5]|uniref:Dipeptide-binding protein n=1 Tax=Capnocytophaga canimorsus (strain 5) TaxID=860228 RepID=F9YQK7_CAPCC|nr:ABC transporter substrate-binding protein [Capnocytophaga canimorsus]AEK23546.1 Dipeptide-binding protein [Capnocytophaga canimorsus Cc5]